MGHIGAKPNSIALPRLAAAARRFDDRGRYPASWSFLPLYAQVNYVPVLFASNGQTSTLDSQFLKKVGRRIR